MSYKWDEFEINYYYPVEVKRLYEAWATPDGLRSFFIEEITVTDSAGTGRGGKDKFVAGDQYSWKWRHDYALSGQFVKAVDNQNLVFSFGSMQVSLHFHAVKDGSLLILNQSLIPTTEEGKTTSHLNCRVCWTFFLTNLKSIFLTGVDLRDNDPARSSSFEVGFKPKEIMR